MLADVTPRERERLYALLGRVKQSVQAHDPAPSSGEDSA